MEKGEVIFLEGDKVRLRPLNEETDLDMCQCWINSPEIRPFIGSGNFPITRVSEKEFFAAANKGNKAPRNIIFGVVIKKTGIMIGTMGLHDIDWVDRSATTGALIGDPANRGQGFGTEAKELLLEYAFQTLNLNRIESRALAYNKASSRYSEKCGYKVEGRARKAIYKDGKYHDIVLLGILKSDWVKRHQTDSQKRKRSK